MVPAIAEREAILRDFHHVGAYCSGDRLYLAIRHYYYWPTLRRECLAAAASALPNKRERARFLPHMQLHPPWKGGGPFQVWVLDCIVGLPPSTHGATTILVAVDAFTKWVEAGPIVTRTAAEVTDWFHSNILARFGRPLVIKTDQGTEFKGAFQTYCDDLGIRMRKINTAAPQG